MNRGKSLLFLQVNCRSIFSKTVDFLNLVDTYIPDVVMGAMSWLREEISNAEIFSVDYTTFRETSLLEVVEFKFV